MVRVYTIDSTPEGEGIVSVYLVVGDRYSALIDAGPSNGSSRVLEFVRRLGLNVDYIVLTHVHIDHGGGAGTLSRALGSRVLVHPRGLKHIVDPSVLWEQSRQALGPVAFYYGEPTPVEESRALQVEDGFILDLGGATLKVIHTPGHASHHMSVYLVEEGLMFTGDSAGVVVDGVVRVPTTPAPFKPKLYLASLERMISERPGRVAVAHYGVVEDGLGYLKWHLEEMRLWLDEVSRIVAMGVTDPVGVAEKLAERLENARIARSSRIAHLYYNTVAGITRAVLDGEWP
jgi:glyoxylase-like metal-dependent hydrolase (beta-lactamase superfamily II)